MDILSDSVDSSLFNPFPSTPPPLADTSLPPDIEALRRLSLNLSSLLLSQNPNFSDFELCLSPNQSISLHKCILSSRSPYFHNLFTTTNNVSISKFELGTIFGDFGVGYEALIYVLGYVYSGTVGLLPRGICECADAECGHVACWPVVDFMLQVLFASFTFEISELVNMFQRRLLDILIEVNIDAVPKILSAANMCGEACHELIAECIEKVTNSDLDSVCLEKTLPLNIFMQILDLRTNYGKEGLDFPNKFVIKIHKALDSDDIDLVKLLLEEGHVSLDDAYALHYAVAFCNSRITTKLLNLKLADVNRKNHRGHTVLHVAAVRKQPDIIICLLDNGAHSYDLTPDGRSAIQISKRLTKAVDYYSHLEQCKDSPKDRLCIEILERAEIRDPPIHEVSNSLTMADDELLQKLQYLEIRVNMAKLLYPMEAKVAMNNAHVDGTSEFILPVIKNPINFSIKEEHILRMQALSKTVELGKRYFPRCADAISKFLDHDIVEFSHHSDSSTTEGGRKRYLELRDEVIEAFYQDRKELDDSVLGLASSTSSKHPRRARSKSAKKR